MKNAVDLPFKHIAVEGVFKSRKGRLANLLAQRTGGRSSSTTSATPT